MTQQSQLPPPQRTAANRIDRIDNSINRELAGEIAVREGGLILRNIAECMEVAKMMSISDTAVPPHLRGNPGACLAISIYAMEWAMSPFAVANKSYVVNDRLSFESQLIHAVVERRAPLTGRLRHSFTGDGDSRQCIVVGRIKGEEPFELKSPMFARIQPKNSPLWKTKPDIQLFYNTCRDWARVYCPDVILGVYSDDEIAAVKAEGGPQSQTGVSAVRKRLGKVAAQPEEVPTAETVEPVEAEAQTPEVTPDSPEPSPEANDPAKADTSPASATPPPQQEAAPDESEQHLEVDEQAGTEQEPEFTDFAGFMLAMEKLCIARKVPKEKCADLLRASILAIDRKGKHDQIKLPTLIGWYQQAQEGSGRWVIFKKKG